VPELHEEEYDTAHDRAYGNAPYGKRYSHHEALGGRVDEMRRPLVEELMASVAPAEPVDKQENGREYGDNQERGY
jgi:hypothetical protein